MTASSWARRLDLNRLETKHLKKSQVEYREINAWIPFYTPSLEMICMVFVLQNAMMNMFY